MGKGAWCNWAAHSVTQKTPQVTLRDRCRSIGGIRNANASMLPLSVCLPGVSWICCLFFRRGSRESVHIFAGEHFNHIECLRMGWMVIYFCEYIYVHVPVAKECRNAAPNIILMWACWLVLVVEDMRGPEAPPLLVQLCCPSNAHGRLLLAPHSRGPGVWVWWQLSHLAGLFFLMPLGERGHKGRRADPTHPLSALRKAGC